MRFLLYISILIALPILPLSIRVYKSYKQQFYMLADFNSNNFEREIDFKNFIVDFPNIGVTTLPLSTIKGEYFYSRKNVKEAIKSYHQGIKSNPYIGASEARLADIYYINNVIDSAIYYSEKAYKLLPLNSKHFLLHLKSLAVEGRVEELDSAIYNNFKYLSQVTTDENYLSTSWQFYLSTVYQYRLINKKKYDSIAKVGLKLFPKNKQIMLVSNFIIYGQDSVQKSLELDELATKEFNEKNYHTSFELFNESVKIWPNNPYSMQSAGISAYMNNNHEKVIYFLENLLEIDNPKDGKTEFYLMNSYLKIRDSINACKYYNKLLVLNPKLIDPKLKPCN